jgi:hypothetical protein
MKLFNALLFFTVTFQFAYCQNENPRHDIILDDVEKNAKKGSHIQAIRRAGARWMESVKAHFNDVTNGELEKKEMEMHGEFLSRCTYAPDNDEADQEECALQFGKIMEFENAHAFQKRHSHEIPKHKTNSSYHNADALYNTNTIDYTSHDKLYNTNPIIYEPTSPEGAFLASENKKFNAINANSPYQKPDQEYISRVNHTVRTLFDEYHPEPPVVQILGEKKVKQKKPDLTEWNKHFWAGKDEKGWFHWDHPFSAPEKIYDVFISEDNIANPLIKEVVQNNLSTLKSFNGRIDDIFTSMGNVVEGSESSQKLEQSLDGLESGLYKDVIGSYAESGIKEILKAYDERLDDNKLYHKIGERMLGTDPKDYIVNLIKYRE